MENIQLATLEYVNAKTAQILKRHNIITAYDLLYFFPAKYDDYTIIPFAEAKPEIPVTVEGIVQSRPTLANVKTNLSVMNFFVEVDGQKVRATLFNRHFLKTKLHYGVYVRLTGKFNPSMKGFTASEIHFDEFLNSIQPVFHIKGMTDEKVLELKQKVYDEFKKSLQEDLPEELLTRYDFIRIKEAIRMINIPESADEVKRALYRLKYEELLKYQLKVKYMMYMRKSHPEGVMIPYQKEHLDQFIKNLPFALTTDQIAAVENILDDMGASYKMNRLLQGEVGSGKTVVAAVALLASVSAGFQGAIMVPTEVLAYQHYQTFCDLFAHEDVKIRLLTSSVSAKDRKEILDALAQGQIDIIIGTHSLFQKDVIFKKLGLVVTDEEHRFGVRQRVSIVGKGYLIDHLKMSATPIPRTLAMSALGDADISIIKTLPGNKKPVITKYLDYKDRSQVVEHLKKEVLGGRQGYIITPMIDESDVMDISNANEVYENTKQYFKGICEVGLIHGKLTPSEKEDIMQKFARNEIQILVATSVIEVGVNVLNATNMVILDADRFGIAQLHQMRGRVLRSDYQAYCYLVSKSESETAIARLQLVRDNADGFVLAEEDLKIRGPGDFFGEKQSGTLTFTVADILLDHELFMKANEDAEIILQEKKLMEEDYQHLYTLVHQNYVDKKEMLE